MAKYAYGWKRQLPDHRDKCCEILYNPFLPARADLRPNMPKVYDQGQLGSCTGNAIAGALQYLLIKEKAKWQFTPSRLFIYYNEREMEGSVLWDAGAVIRDGIKSVNKLGVCPEDSGSGWSWPYSDDPIRYRIKPWPACYKDALLHKSLDYASVPQTEMGMKTILSEGFPIILGIVVYDSFESADATKTGNIPMPARDESVLGGHAIVITGYSDQLQRFFFRNSWGEKWGDGGYGTIPYHYILNQNLCSDLWAIKMVK